MIQINRSIKMKKIAYVFQLLLVITLVGACATGPTSDVSVGNPEASIRLLEENLTDARSRDIDVLSPEFYKSAESSLVNAKQALNRGAKLSTIQRYVDEGNSELSQAEKIAQVSNTILGKTNESREKALKVGADKLGEPYMEVENQYLTLTRAIENDNLSYAQKHSPEVTAGFREVEIMAIKSNALGNARKMMADAEKARLYKTAPTAYDSADKALKEAEMYAGQNPYDAEEISNKNLQAEFMARRLFSLSDSTEKFKQMDSEASALYLESLLAQLSATLNIGDIRDKGVDDQIMTMAGTVDSMKEANKSLGDENVAYSEQVAQLQQRLAGLQDYSEEQELAKRKLAAERQFNEQFDTVQSYFQPEEAEVYKQGRNLVIRLRGIKFPVGKATLTPDNYTLLSKVQKAIQTFDQPNVMIEGHTDSTGSAQTNQALSQERADAVKAYLVANKTLSESNVRSMGFGPDRPLAPNTTPEGRATNRRIDVVISPTQSPEA
jgi:OOP family OmpA-OmpF porin